MKTRVLVPLLLVAAVIPAAAVSAASSARIRQVADLKSFIHGEPVAPRKAPPPKVTAVVSTIAGVKPDPQVEDFFRAFADALKAREGARMLPRLSDQYTIADLPEGHKASEFFVMGIDRTPGPEAIVIQSVELQGAVRLVKAEFRYPEKVAVKAFKFDATGRLLATDLFKLRREGHGL